MTSEELPRPGSRQWPEGAGIPGSGPVGRAGHQSFWSRQIDLAVVWHVVRDHPFEALLGLGVFLRVLEYLRNRSYWMDEGSLLGNLKGVGVLDFSGTWALINSPHSVS